MRDVGGLGLVGGWCWLVVDRRGYSVFLLDGTGKSFHLLVKCLDLCRHVTHKLLVLLGHVLECLSIVLVGVSEDLETIVVGLLCGGLFVVVCVHRISSKTKLRGRLRGLVPEIVFFSPEGLKIGPFTLGLRTALPLFVM
jgi:hypothetical protein